MRNKLKKAMASPCFVPIVAAPVLFGISALILSLRYYNGAWYYALYFLLHFLSAGLFFFALHRLFFSCETRGFPRALTSAIPLLVSLSVYHFAIAFYDAYVVQFEDAPTALVYALLSLFTDSLLSEWLLLFLSFAAAYFFFLRGGATPSGRQAARLLSALLFFAYLSIGRIAEFVSYRSAHFGVAGEKTTVSFLLFAGADLLFSAFGYLVLFLSDKAAEKNV